MNTSDKSRCAESFTGRFFGHSTPECTPEFRCECIVQQQLKDENACSFSLRVDLARVRWQQSHSTKWTSDESS